MMYLHIQFKNGSNPYLMYGDINKLWKELKRWVKNYRLEISVKDNIEVVAEERSVEKWT